MLLIKTRSPILIQRFFILGFIITWSSICKAGDIEDSAPSLSGHLMGLSWTIPFIGILFSLALIPLISSSFWNLHYGKISFIWGVAVFVPLAYCQGFYSALYETLHTYLLEYVPFIIILATLYTISGGIKIEINRQATPLLNVGLLMTGTMLANFIGTTGAAMLLIRPLIKMNTGRRNKTHLIIFFIFLVCNLGGSLSALGDPPLFLGFLNGIDFFWPTIHLFLPFMIILIPLGGIFYIFDHFYYRQEKRERHRENSKPALILEGKVNFFLLISVIVTILLTSQWHSQIFCQIFYVKLKLQNLIRDIALVLIAITSYRVTPQKIRRYNNFSWHPILEVAGIFAAIFITAMPVVAILDSGTQGALAPLVKFVNYEGVPVNAMYFWITGILSGFLDNAPTYLIFFHMASGNPTVLMTTLSGTLTAISCGAVFMGAMTYIGNAPNFMVKSIAEENHISMPSFFGYLKWSLGILFPLFILLSLLVF